MVEATGALARLALLPLAFAFEANKLELPARETGLDELVFSVKSAFDPLFLGGTVSSAAGATAASAAGVGAASGEKMILISRSALAGESDP